MTEFPQRFPRCETFEEICAFLKLHAEKGGVILAEDVIVQVNLIQLKRGDLTNDQKFRIKEYCLTGFKIHMQKGNLRAADQYLKIIENLRNIDQNEIPELREYLNRLIAEDKQGQDEVYAGIASIRGITRERLGL